MRIIKFRAWDENANKMIPWDEITKADGNHFLTLSNLLNGFIKFIKPMQYTGLKDKNGVEIYEGDIIEWLDHSFPITVDEFHGYRFMFGEDILTKAYAIYGEVIGNIHER